MCAPVTAVRPHADGFHADLDPQWAVGDKLHGGYLMALADCAAGYAAFTDGRHYVTQSSHMSFLKNVSSGEIFANARVLKRGRLVSVVRVEIFSGEECLLCEGSFNCYCIEPGESGK